MPRRSIPVMLVTCIAVIGLMAGGCNTTGLFGRRQTVNTGEVTSVTSERVCISSENPDGEVEKCFQIEDDTHMPDGVERGDLVEVWFDDLVANEVRHVPAH